MERKISRSALEVFTLPEIEDFYAKKFWHLACSKSFSQSGVPFLTFLSCLEESLEINLQKADRIAIEATMFRKLKISSFIVLLLILS
jgi:hypothetical protein